MLEQTMVLHGAPTLAGLKTGSLFSVHTDGIPDIERDVERINQTLEPKGVRLTVMKRGQRRVLLYLYREAMLSQCLACPKAGKVLRQCGYGRLTVCGALDTLRERLSAQEGFPHEIGLFLGYPLTDVTGFMRHGGKNCLFCGCWKVYGEEAAAMRTFARYRKCTELYSKRFYTGTPLNKLTVAARSAF